MVPCESEHYVESEIEQKFWFYYYLLYGQTRYFLITGFDENENYSRKTMPGIFYSAILKKSMKRKYDFKILEDTAFLTINSFAYDYLSSYGYKNYLKQSFNKIRSRKIRKLVIDIHNNRGGSTEYAELLLKYLTTKPLYYWSRCIVKRSKLAEKCGYSFENGMKYGEVREYNRSPSESNEKQEAVYDGETILVVGKHCFSTSIDFAVAFKNAELGKIVGENTGGIKNSSEAQVFFKLPLSGLAFMIPGKYYISSGNHFSDDGTFKPDVIIDLSDQQKLVEQLKEL
jgi:C-terminal processing protease CtpA/Prc